MSPVNNNNNSHNNSHNRRVEFAPTLLDAGMDSEAPAAAAAGGGSGSGGAGGISNTGLWDTETDHMLSYFLGGSDGLSQGQYSTVPHADFASTATSSPLSSLAVTSEDQQDNSPVNSWQLPPPTPAVQFYSHTPTTNTAGTGHSPSRSVNMQHRSLRHRSGDSLSQQQQLTSTSQSSSSSSLSSMAAALISGVSPGMLYHNNNNNAQQLHLQRVAAAAAAAGGNNTPIFPTPPTMGYGGESPLSPTAMIGCSEHENLFFPPPPSSDSSPVMYDAAVRNSAGNERLMAPPEPRHPTTTYSWPQPGSGGNTSNDSSSMPPPPPHSMMAPLFPQPNNSTGHSMMHHHHAIAAAPHAPSILQPPQQHHHHHQQQQQQQQLLYTTAAALQAAAALQQQIRGGSVPEEESEEKRAKRLERNRESARKCRRRKKERLATLGAQVNRLHNQIEGERRKLINSMVPAMQVCRCSETVNLLIEHEGAASEEVEDRLLDIIRGSSPSSEMMRSVLEFQYTMLKQLILPDYQKMLLWLTLRDEKYFTAGKEQYLAKQQRQQRGTPENAASRSAVGKISSKQVGDELLNGPIIKQDKKAATKRDKDGGGSDGELANPSSAAYDAARTWPLFCFELKFSVDQEERFLATQKQVNEGLVDGKNDLAYKREQLAAAVITTDSMGKAVGSLSHVVARREERTILGILNPRQVAAYQAWLSTDRNRERCRHAVAERGSGSSSLHFMDVSSASDGSSGNKKEVSLHDISRRLSEVLQISSKSDSIIMVEE